MSLVIITSNNEKIYLIMDYYITFPDAELMETGVVAVHYPLEFNKPWLKL